MERAPRAAGARILSGRMMAWLVLVGLLMGAITLPVIAWAEAGFGPDVARTMGVSTFALLGAAFAIETRDERRSILSDGYLADRTLLVTVGATVLLTVLAAEIGILERIISTVPLTIEQWLVCFGGAGVMLVACEIRKRLWVPSATPPRVG
jgi:Ca2+-transporting ATPase